MDELEVVIEKQFTAIDYVFLVCILGVSFIIGITSSLMGNRSPEEFLLGNRSFSPIPVSMSLLTTVISAVNIVGLSTEVYVYGTQLSLMAIGTIFGIAFSILVIMPVIYPLKLISIHEYIDMRFNAPLLQILMMILIVFNALIWIGLALYATAIALSAVSPINYAIFIIAIGSVCTLYSTIGGIRAVVWTDVFQFWVMLAGLIIIVVAGFVEVGGVTKLFEIAEQGQRLEFFNMNPSIYERHSFYNTFIFGAFIYGSMFSISQINTQRICAVSTLENAQLVLKINMFGMALIQIIIFLGGLVAYAAYAGCDPKLTGMVGKRNEIFSFLIVDKLGYIYGLPGIYVATMIASTLSTFSSVLNAQVALIWKDLLCKFKYFQNAKPWLQTAINKMLTIVVGIGFILMAFVTSKASSIIQLVLSAGGIVFGSIFGIFILGICFPQSNATGAWIGFIVSIFINTWMCAGNMLYGTPPKELPFSTSECGNHSFANWTMYAAESSLNNYSNGNIYNDTSSNLNEEISHESFPLLYLYDISYTMYSVFSPLFCVVIGLIVSLLTRNKESHEVPPELITPLLHRFYYKKYEVQSQSFS